MIFIKNLKFKYELQAEYSDLVSSHNFSVMFLPVSTNRQEITELDINIVGCNKYCKTSDNFNNKKIYGNIKKPHRCFDITVTGKAKTGIDIYEEYTNDMQEYSILKFPTQLTYPHKKIREYHKNLEMGNFISPYEKALHIMHTLYYTFRYKQGATSIHATAEEALNLGEGVCQDYAHIMLALLRMENIPARYVVGVMLGEGSSHAWVEVLCNGYWYGFDPTNNKLVNDEYIRVSSGRDSSDCAVIRGTFKGCVTQTQKESVSVEEIY